MVGLDYQASLNTPIIGPASDTGFGLVANARSCKVAETMNSICAASSLKAGIAIGEIGGDNYLLAPILVWSWTVR